MIFRQKIFTTLLITAVALPIAAYDIVKCSTKELSSHLFLFEEVSIQITELNGYKGFDAARKFSGRARVSISLANRSSHVRKFTPQDLSFVGKDGLQVFPIYEKNLADDTLPMTLQIAPGAHVSMEYALSGRLTFPAKIYYGESVIAEVSE
jgi:hypothetical protein